MNGGLHGPAVLDGLEVLATDWIRERLKGTPPGVVGDPVALAAALSGSITDAGLGLEGGWATFRDVVAPHNTGLDSDRFLAFIPLSPSVAGVWMDAVVGAANFSAESWFEAAGAVAAEQAVLRLLADAAGMPPSADGCFMSGGSIGNLSALAVARDHSGGRRTVVVADTAHASIDNALHLLGMQPLVVETGASCRLTGEAIRSALAQDPDRAADVAAVVAAGGSTNAGVIDDLDGCADVATEIGAWFHVDGAYGIAAVLLPEMGEAFRGLGRADSFIVDPHKWLFAPAGSCALLYRRPELARSTHTQHGPYIDIIHTSDDAALYNPSDLGYQLTRRASGLPVWFALTVHGLEAHRTAIRRGVELARLMAEALDADPTTELVLPPQLGVVLFRRAGWGAEEWRAWAARCLAEQVAFVAPSTYKGEPVGRLVFMHPSTPASIVGELMETLRD